MTHHCHAIRCNAPCPPRMLMCRACWSLVSPETQAEVYRTVKLRTGASADATWAPWWRASARAEVENGEARGVFNPGGARFWLAKAFSFATYLEDRDYDAHEARLAAARMERDQ